MSEALGYQQALDVLAEADLIVSAADAEAAVLRMAAAIAQQLAARHPLVLCVMGGAVVFTGNLLLHLRFPLAVDFLHVTRYGAATTGGALDWRVGLKDNVKGRCVLVLDDILDEGNTLNAIRTRVIEHGAAECFTAVFADKNIGRDKPIRADFVGLQLPNRYVFGYGMDVSGAWRNLPAVYAVRGM